MASCLDTLPFLLVWQRCHSRSFSSHVLSVNTSPLFLLRLASLSPQRQDAHAIVLSRPYWSSDVELIKDNLQGLPLPLSRRNSLWQSAGPSNCYSPSGLDGTDNSPAGALVMLPPPSLPAISSFHLQQLNSISSFLCLSPTHSKRHCPAQQLWLWFETVRFLSFCSDTAHQSWSPQQLHMCVGVCVCVNLMCET